MDNYTLYWVIIAGIAVGGLVLLMVGLVSAVKGKSQAAAAILLFLALCVLFLALGCGGILHVCQAGSPACQ